MRSALDFPLLLLSLALLVAGAAGAAPEAPEDADLAAGSSAAQGSEVASECDPLFEECEEAATGDAAFPDPFESANRVTLSMNRVFDTVLLDPLTKFYGWILPNPVKLAIRRMIDNLEAPAIAVNDGLQLEWIDMGVTVVRFGVNSTIGLAGLFDPAAAMGLEHHHSDFGQTLTLAGVASGPYLILPILGPTTVRDGTGAMVDVALSPLLYFFGPLSFEQLYRGGSGLAVREEHLRGLEALEESSIDFYAAMRSAFFQSRQAEIWGRREHRR